MFSTPVWSRARRPRTLVATAVVAAIAGVAGPAMVGSSLAAAAPKPKTGAATTTSTSTSTTSTTKATTSTTAPTTSTSTSSATPSTTVATTGTTVATTSTTAATTSTPTATAGVPLVGFNEQWNSQAGLDQILTDADIAAIKATGAKAVRFPVQCNSVGACAFTNRLDDSTDFRTVTTWDFTQLDRAISKLLAAGITPVVGPEPGNRMFRPGWIVDDDAYASTSAYVQAIVNHLGATFGPLPYSFFETDQTTSLVTGLDGVTRYRYLSAVGFPASFASGLQALYGGNLAALNAAYGTAYTSFAAVPVPDLGSSLGIPALAMDAPATYDVRRVIGQLSAARYSAIGDMIHAASPGSEWWGPTVQIQSYDDLRQVHTVTQLTPVGPTLSDLAAQPGIDVLSVDGYRNDGTWTAPAEWRVAAKSAARAGKKLAITEVGDQTAANLQNAVTSVQRGASNLRAVLVWQAKDDPSAGTTTFGMITSTGTVRTDRSSALTSFFSAITGTPSFATYTPGTEAVYYPEWSLQVVQSGKLTTTKTLALMGDLMAAGKTVEPLTDAEVAAGNWNRISVYSLYLGDQARTALAASTKPAMVYQYASHRTGFAAGKAVDTPLWAARDGFTASATEVTPRAAETVTLLGSPYPVTTDFRLQGWPFVHLSSSGLTTVIGTHSAAVCGCAMAVRTVGGSVWSDEYVGAASIPALYAKL